MNKALMPQSQATVIGQVAALSDEEVRIATHGCAGGAGTIMNVTDEVITQNELPGRIAALLEEAQKSRFKDERRYEWSSWKSVSIRASDALRLKVSILVGWKDLRWQDQDCPNNADWYSTPTTRQFHRVPFYSSDLNAMHEAEKRLSKRQQSDYLDNILTHLPDWPRPYVDEGGRIWDLSHATARQRAEAFVLTLSLKSLNEPNENSVRQ